MKPTIVEPAAVDLDVIRKHLHVELAGERDDLRKAERHDKERDRHAAEALTARQSAQARRLRIGGWLAKARVAWPERGPNAKGWGSFLAEFGIDDATARRYMDEHRDPEGFAQRQAKTDPARGERDPKPASAPAPVSEADIAALVAQLDPDARGRIQRSIRSLNARENEGDRDSYCTPLAITAALPEVDFDPCSNPRSAVRARRTLQLERGENGLEVAWVGSGFWNIPYSKPLPWAEKFDRERAAITAAGWLVNEDHSPAWWHLLTKSLPIRLDFDERLEFTPPPGVTPSKNDRPQTLLMDAPFWAACDQGALLAMGKLWVRADHAQDIARALPPALHIVR